MCTNIIYLFIFKTNHQHFECQVYFFVWWNQFMAFQPGFWWDCQSLRKQNLKLNVNCTRIEIIIEIIYYHFI